MWGQTEEIVSVLDFLVYLARSSKILNLFQKLHFKDLVQNFSEIQKYRM